MTPPLLLLGLYAGLLAVALALASWLSHAIPADENARRVSDAAERAALSHLLAPARTMTVTLLALGAILGCYFYLTGGPFVWAALSPLACSLLACAALYYCARKLLKASSQQQQLVGVDTPLAFTSRAALSVVLCCEAASGLIVLGLYVIAVQELSHRQAMQVVATGLLGLGICLAIFARSLGCAGLCRDSSDSHDTPPPAPSLARLVGDAFHAPAQRLFALVCLSSFGHWALLMTLGSEDTAAELSSLWLFPHLLKLLGLLALIFSALVVRANEDETGTSGWQRGGLVFLVLGIAGAWALSSELPSAWARSVPAGITFFLLITAALVGLPTSGGSGRRDISRSSANIANRNLLPLLGFIALLLILLGVSPTSTPEQSLPSSGLLRLLTGGVLAVAPLGLSWHLAKEIERGAVQARRLAQSGPSSDKLVLSPTAPMLQAFPILCFLAVVATWANSESQRLTAGSLPFMFCFLGILVGAISVAASLGTAGDRGSPTGKAAQHKLAGPSDEAPLNLQAAVERAREAGAKSLAAWLCQSLLPTTMLLGLMVFGEAKAAAAFAMGAGLGAVLLGTGLEYLFHGAPSPSRRAQGRIAIILALVQSIWLFATTVVLR